MLLSHNSSFASEADIVIGNIYFALLALRSLSSFKVFINAINAEKVALICIIDCCFPEFCDR